MPRILLIEDEPEMQRGLKHNLEFEGYDVDIAGDGEAGLTALVQGPYDVALLDVMLPGISGFDVCRQARAQGVTTPIIMVTAKGQEIDKVLGLEIGADDYITKPFGVRELLARVKAMLRRSDGSGGTAPEQVFIGSLKIDFAAYAATRDGAPVSMTPREIDILKFLWLHRNKSVSRDQLLSAVWGYNQSVTTRTVDNFILRIRQKVESDPAHPVHIITIHGVGYKLVAT